MSKAWMPLYIADYLADTVHLDCSESGAYLHLIMAYWQHGGLPNDDKKLARIAKAKQLHFTKMRPILIDFFDENWKHKRIDEELKKSSGISAVRREIARKRWSNCNANEYSKASANGDAKPRARARALQSQSHKESLNGVGRQGRENPHFVKEDTPQWTAWAEFWKKTKGRVPNKIFQRGTNAHGWYFPTEWPPSES